KVLTFPVLPETHPGSHLPTGNKTSLIGAIQDDAADFLFGNRLPEKEEKVWHPVRRGFDCWWRPACLKSGKVVVLIGLRHRVANQVMKPLPGVVSQPTLRRMCANAGVLLSSKAKIRIRLSDSTRLVVLGLKFTRRMFAKPKTHRKVGKPPPAGPP